MKTFLVAAIVVLACVAGMSVTIILKKGGEFPKYDVGSNPEMRKRGIQCYKDVDAALHKRKCSGNFSEACKDCALGPSSK